MFSRLWLAVAPLLIAVPSILQAQTQPVRVDQLRRHIEVLASDAYQGRKPGTEGEVKTLLYLASQFQAVGLEPAAGDGRWYQPVGLVERNAFAHRALFAADEAPVEFAQEDLILIGREPRIRVADAPVYFVGHGLADQIAAADLKGAVAFVLYTQPSETKAPGFPERARALVDAGAAAIIAVFSDEVPWSAVSGAYGEQIKLQDEPVAPITGATTAAAAQRLLEATGAKFDPARAVRLDARASIDVSTRVRSYASHNVVGRLRGTGTTGQSVLYLGHWDHLGICRPEGAEDRICNGAVDNASGLAVLIEVARNLARGKRPARDILFLATTAEEMGLLGAEYFGANPVVPIESIVAAVNLDTVAIHGRGEPVAVIGRGNAPLDAAIAEAAAELGRRMDNDGDADIMVTRQDGWALTKAGVPTVMVGGSFSDMGRLQAFLAGPYHKPHDDLERDIVLDGAAEDADLLIALGRRLADLARYKPGQLAPPR